MAHWCKHLAQCSHPTGRSSREGGGGGVGGYLHNQIRGSKSGTVVQALSSYQCSHPTGKSSREAGGGEGGEGLST